MRSIQYVVRLMTFIDGHRTLNQTIQCVNKGDAHVVADAFTGQAATSMNGKIVDLERQAEVCAAIYTPFTGRLILPLHDVPGFARYLTDAAEQIEDDGPQIKRVV